LYAPNDPLVDSPDHETGPTGNSQSSFEFLDSDFISASDIFTTFPEPFQDTMYSDLLFSPFLNSPAVTIDQTIEERTPDTAASPRLQGDWTGLPSPESSSSLPWSTPSSQCSMIRCVWPQCEETFGSRSAHKYVSSSPFPTPLSARLTCSLSKSPLQISQSLISMPTLSSSPRHEIGHRPTYQLCPRSHGEVLLHFFYVQSFIAQEWQALFSIGQLSKTYKDKAQDNW